MGIAELRRLLLVALVALVIATCALIAVVALGDGGGGEDEGEEVVGPKIGDHWHAAISIIVCSEKTDDVPEFESTEGIHTHGDGIIHMHPLTLRGEGDGATLARFLEYGGYELRDLTRLSRRAFDTVEELEACIGHEAEFRILRADSGIHPLAGGEGASFSEAIETCDAMGEADFGEVDPDYVPQDGDCVRIVFGP